ncbi:3-phosphoshikimate 1-carboxyvinyltransferase [Chlorobium sp. BLA1]|uniref:3-phosphoshikimate 1-carboxyvinyltransferase n=1 Tax=Candidatus Chlorobium masyuteum TaxID=2716876 RepID=UPI00141DA9C6|nr:3-phosphoshikimate 1-carboxyvinyltransferase [Candidatus Chlorobium masyuteum]NHQ59347.1 3-phosphoshikimate 1-carboxyvinyltransferase [Candidatus Chlorobium masyuteum]
MRVFKGEVTALPPDKSISHRAALIGALSEGTTEITNFSGGFDNQSTLSVLQRAGIALSQEEIVQLNGRTQRRVVIKSRGLWSFQLPAEPLMCNNSGSTMRMFAGILAAQPFKSELIGDSSLMKRPMKRVADPLRLMGADIELSSSGTAPIVINGTKELKPIAYRLPVPSAQVKSLVALAALHADGESRIIEQVRSRDHTEVMLGLESFEQNGERVIVVPGRKQIEAKPFYIPADPSAACFIVALGLLARGSEIMIRDVCLNPTRAAFLDILMAAGAGLRIENLRVIGGESIGDILVSTTSEIEPLCISDPQLIAIAIDEIPMLAVLSAFATGRFELHNAAELRTKESDRIDALVVNLERLGFVCEQYPDGFVVTGRNQAPSGSVVLDSFDDHRIAMSFAIAGRATGGAFDITDIDVVGVSFPNFFELLDSLEV